MKATTSKLLLFCLFVMAIASCKKAPETPTGMFVNLDTYEAKEITAISAVVEAKAKADCTERGVCWGKKPSPTIDDFHVANGSGKGEYACTLTDLEPDQKYYYRAYAHDGKRYVYAQDEKNFTTKDGIVLLTTGDVTDITATSTKCSGNVIDDGGFAVIERGICWSISPNPTLDNAEHIVSGSGVGSFQVVLTSLEGSTTYHVRAYAVNINGTQYGEDVFFTTLIPPLTFTANGVSFEMIYVESGTFWMGAQSTDPSGQNYDSEAWDEESPVHQVTLSSYHIGKFEVTQELWQAVMGYNPSEFTGDSQRPVEKVSWNDCQEFITKLNQQCASQLNGRQFALPTEAQWEYAARGGKNSKNYKYSGGNTIDDVAWYDDNSSNTTHAVGTKTPNELGLYDMSGNVWEWCSDWYGSYSSSAQTNPTGPTSGSRPVFRGSGWNGVERYCCVSFRRNFDVIYMYGHIGLRLSLR